MELTALANGAEQVRLTSVLVWDPPIACDAAVIRSYAPVTTQFRVIDASHPEVPHGGRDYGVSDGTPIYSAKAGRVKHAGDAGTAGISVVVKSSTVTSRYYHLQSEVITVGDSVSAGQLLGYSGHTGHVEALNGGNGAHLHFEQWKPGTETWIDKKTVFPVQIEPCTF